MPYLLCIKKLLIFRKHGPQLDLMHKKELDGGIQQVQGQ